MSADALGAGLPSAEHDRINDEAARQMILMAAARDLLEACKAAENCIGELSPTLARVDAMRMLQAAIEKAGPVQPSVAGEQRPIPVASAIRIAKEFGYDQVVIVGRRVAGFEHVTTYGVDAANCWVAARMGHFFKHVLMVWPKDEAQA